MVNCFFFLTQYISLKRYDSMQQENSLFSLIRDWQKKDKNILVSVEKEKEKLTLIVIFHYSYP